MKKQIQENSLLFESKKTSLKRKVTFSQAAPPTTVKNDLSTAVNQTEEKRQKPILKNAATLNVEDSKANLRSHNSLNSIKLLQKSSSGILQSEPKPKANLQSILGKAMQNIQSSKQQMSQENQKESIGLSKGKTSLSEKFGQSLRKNIIASEDAKKDTRNSLFKKIDFSALKSVIQGPAPLENQKKIRITQQIDNKNPLLSLQHVMSGAKSSTTKSGGNSNFNEEPMHSTENDENDQEFELIQKKSLMQTIGRNLKKIIQKNSSTLLQKETSVFQEIINATEDQHSHRQIAEKRDDGEKGSNRGTCSTCTFSEVDENEALDDSDSVASSIGDMPTSNNPNNFVEEHRSNLELNRQMPKSLQEQEPQKTSSINQKKLLMALKPKSMDQVIISPKVQQNLDMSQRMAKEKGKDNKKKFVEKVKPKIQFEHIQTTTNQTSASSSSSNSISSSGQSSNSSSSGSSSSSHSGSSSSGSDDGSNGSSQSEANSSSSTSCQCSDCLNAPRSCGKSSTSESTSSSGSAGSISSSSKSQSSMTNSMKSSQNKQKKSNLLKLRNPKRKGSSSQVSAHSIAPSISINGGCDPEQDQQHDLKMLGKQKQTPHTPESSGSNKQNSSFESSQTSVSQSDTQTSSSASSENSEIKKRKSLSRRKSYIRMKSKQLEQAWEQVTSTQLKLVDQDLQPAYNLAEINSISFMNSSFFAMRTNFIRHLQKLNQKHLEIRDQEEKKMIIEKNILRLQSFSFSNLNNESRLFQNSMIDELLQIGQKEAKFKDKIFKLLEMKQEKGSRKFKKSEDPFSSHHQNTRSASNNQMNYHSKSFYESLIPCLLFTLNMSQEEILNVYGRFCKNYFKTGGLAVTPKMATKQEIEHLTAFLGQQHFMNKEQAREVCSDIQFTAKYGDKDAQGNALQITEFIEIMPHLMLALFFFVTESIKKRQQLMQQMVEHDEINSLHACFERHGLARSDFAKKKISYAMVEQALITFKNRSEIGVENLEIVLRQVRERMGVSQADRLESEKEFLVHQKPQKCFGRWLMQKIHLQILWKEIAQQMRRERNFDKQEFETRLIYQQKIWEMARVYDCFDRKKFNKEVSRNLLILTHTRNFFRVDLDLTKAETIKQALNAHIETVVTDSYQEGKPETTKEEVLKHFERTLEKQFSHSLLKPKHTTIESNNQQKKQQKLEHCHIYLHDFNEAIYSALSQYSSYLSFGQIEEATMAFIVDQLLGEEVRKILTTNSSSSDKGSSSGKVKVGTANNKVSKESKDRLLSLYQQVRRQTKHVKTSSKDLKYSSALKWGQQVIVQNLTYGRAFADQGYHHNHHQNNNNSSRYRYNHWPMSRFLRRRDFIKIASGQYSTAQDFRQVKLATPEFSRFAFQILFEESLRAISTTVALKWSGTPHCVRVGQPQQTLTDEGCHGGYKDSLIRLKEFSMKDLTEVRMRIVQQRNLNLKQLHEQYPLAQRTQLKFKRSMNPYLFEKSVRMLTNLGEKKERRVLHKNEVMLSQIQAAIQNLEKENSKFKHKEIESAEIETFENQEGAQLINLSKNDQKQVIDAYLTLQMLFKQNIQLDGVKQSTDNALMEDLDAEMDLGDDMIDTQQNHLDTKDTLTPQPTPGEIGQDQGKDNFSNSSDEDKVQAVKKPLIEDYSETATSMNFISARNERLSRDSIEDITNFQNVDLFCKVNENEMRHCQKNIGQLPSTFQKHLQRDDSKLFPFENKNTAKKSGSFLQGLMSQLSLNKKQNASKQNLDQPQNQVDQDKFGAKKDESRKNKKKQMQRPQFIFNENLLGDLLEIQKQRDQQPFMTPQKEEKSYKNQANKSEERSHFKVKLESSSPNYNNNGRFVQDGQKSKAMSKQLLQQNNMNQSARRDLEISGIQVLDTTNANNLTRQAAADVEGDQSFISQNQHVLLLNNFTGNTLKKEKRKQREKSARQETEEDKQEKQLYQYSQREKEKEKMEKMVKKEQSQRKRQQIQSDQEDASRMTKQKNSSSKSRPKPLKSSNQAEKIQGANNQHNLSNKKNRQNQLPSVLIESMLVTESNRRGKGGELGVQGDSTFQNESQNYIDESQHRSRSNKLGNQILKNTDRRKREQQLFTTQYTKSIKTVASNKNKQQPTTTSYQNQQKTMTLSERIQKGKLEMKKREEAEKDLEAKLTPDDEGKEAGSNFWGLF